jgi:hypothetical protein
MSFTTLEGGFCSASALVRASPSSQRSSQHCSQLLQQHVSQDGDEHMQEALRQLKTYFGYNCFRFGQVINHH